MNDYAGVELLCKRYPELNTIKAKIMAAISEMIKTYQNGGKVLLCGNGGSCADADHIVGELMKGFCKKRPLPPELRSKLERYDCTCAIAEKLQQPLRAINLGQHQSLTTAFSNDVDAGLCFAQQALGYTDQNDVFIGITTSGNAQNVYTAAVVAKAMGAVIIGLTGESGGKIAGLCDVLLNVPERETYRVQELHLPVYHTLCLAVEEYFFKL